MRSLPYFIRTRHARSMVLNRNKKNKTDDRREKKWRSNRARFQLERKSKISHESLRRTSRFASSFSRSRSTCVVTKENTIPSLLRDRVRRADTQPKSSEIIVKTNGRALTHVHSLFARLLFGKNKHRKFVRFIRTVQIPHRQSHTPPRTRSRS